MQLTDEQKEAIRAVLEYLEDDREEYLDLYKDPQYGIEELDKHIGKHLDTLSKWLLDSEKLPCAFCGRSTPLNDMVNWPRPGRCDENYVCEGCCDKLMIYTDSPHG